MPFIAQLKARFLFFLPVRYTLSTFAMNFLSHRFIFITGILVAIMPFLGFPSLWKSVFYVIFGLYVISISFFIKDSKRPSGKAWVLRREKAFIENSPSTGGKRRVIRKKPKEESISPTIPVSEPAPQLISNVTPSPDTKEQLNGISHGA